MPIEASSHDNSSIWATGIWRDESILNNKTGKTENGNFIFREMRLGLESAFAGSSDSVTVTLILAARDTSEFGSNSGNIIRAEQFRLQWTNSVWLMKSLTVGRFKPLPLTWEWSIDEYDLGPVTYSSLSKPTLIYGDDGIQGGVEIHNFHATFGLFGGHRDGGIYIDPNNTHRHVRVRAEYEFRKKITAGVSSRLNTRDQNLLGFVFRQEFENRLLLAEVQYQYLEDTTIRQWYIQAEQSIYDERANIRLIARYERIKQDNKTINRYTPGIRALFFDGYLQIKSNVIHDALRTRIFNQVGFYATFF